MTKIQHDLEPNVTDVSDMYVVHRTFRRELRILPTLVRAVRPGDTARAAVIARHARLVLDGLHLHHTGEDELLWPLLLERVELEHELIERMEQQHHRVEALVEQLRPALERWEVEARPAVAEEVAGTIDALRVTLLEHLAEEEAQILPLAARHVSQPEWDALGEHGVGQMTKSQLMLMGSMMLEEATPEERAAMLGELPPPVRFVLRTIGARQYRRYVSRVRSTS